MAYDIKNIETGERYGVRIEALGYARTRITAINRSIGRRVVKLVEVDTDAPAVQPDAPTSEGK